MRGNKKNPAIVVIGGGTGSFTLLSGLKNYTRNLTAIINTLTWLMMAAQRACGVM